MDRSQYKKVTNQSISEIEIDQDFDQIMDHLNSKNPDQPIKFPEDTELVLPKLSLEGILTIGKDENGIVGLEIPDLLSINNYPAETTGTEVLPTNGNLCLRDYTADLLRADNPNEILLTYWKNASIDEQSSYKLYKDSQNLVYAYGNLDGPEDGLTFIGAYDESLSQPLTAEITVAPQWTSENVFQLSDNGKTVELWTINRLLFSTENTSIIHAPKTLLVCSGIFQNFGGTLDISSCTKITTSDYIDVTYYTNCTNGTLLVNATQYSAISSRIDTHGLLDGKIKVQQKIENEDGEES